MDPACIADAGPHSHCLALPQARYKQKWLSGSHLQKDLMSGAACGNTIRCHLEYLIYFKYLKYLPHTSQSCSGFKDRQKTTTIKTRRAFVIGTMVLTVLHNSKRKTKSLDPMPVNHRVKAGSVARVTDPPLGRPFLSCISTSSNETAC